MIKRSQQKELIDNFELSGKALIRNLNELIFVNRYLGGFRLLIDGFERALKIRGFPEHYLKIADYGCGDGSNLRHLAAWARKRNIIVKFTGIDANAYSIRYAKRQSRFYPEIDYVHADIYDEAITQLSFDLITCNLLWHHIAQECLPRFILQLVQQANHTVIVNDLHRHYLAYLGIKLLTKLLPCSSTIRNDAPISVLRGFRRCELLTLLANISNINYTIKWFWAFRYQILIFP